MHSQRQIVIKEKIKDCMREKFQSYSPETSYMPFHHRLLGRADGFVFLHPLLEYKIWHVIL